MRADERLKRHRDEELRVELAEDLESLAQALAGVFPLADQGRDRRGVGVGPQLSHDLQDGALVRGESFNL